MTATEPRTEFDGRFSDPTATATPWADARRLLEDAELFWISTVRSDGRPHVTPLPAVWLDGAAHFCTGPGEQKGQNLQRNPQCILTTGCNRWKEGLDLVIEGAAVRVADDAELQRLAAAWETKYHGDWHFDVRDGAFQGEGGEAWVYGVAPDKILGFAKGPFAQTRWRFDDLRT